MKIKKIMQGIAKINCTGGTIKCEINKYYLDGNHHTDKYESVQPCEIVKNYPTIKFNSDKQTNAEKKAHSVPLLTL
jgi:hypothetical protein